jgi:hypothetical protein
MSKRNTPLHDIQILSTTELVERYGIEIDDDESVWDTVEGRSFKSLKDWAIYTEEQDELYGETNSPYIYEKTPSNKELDGWY